MKKTKIFFFETKEYIAFYSFYDETKLIVIKNDYTFKEFQKIKNNYDFISLI